MVFGAHRVIIIILIVCFEFLAVQPGKVDGLTSIDLVLKQSKRGRGTIPDNVHFLKDVFIRAKKAEKKLTATDMVLEPSKNVVHGMVLHSQRMLKDVVAKQGLNTEKRSENLRKTFDSNQSSKRRVRRGSDPIHNRS